QRRHRREVAAKLKVAVRGAALTPDRRGCQQKREQGEGQRTRFHDAGVLWPSDYADRLVPTCPEVNRQQRLDLAIDTKLLPVWWSSTAPVAGMTAVSIDTLPRDRLRRVSRSEQCRVEPTR